MQSTRLACQAMATRFELVLRGNDQVHLRAAGEEAISLIQDLEARFSFYDARSELSKVNRLASERVVPVSTDMMEVLSLCHEVHEDSHGAFDPTVGRLMQTWRFSDSSEDRSLPNADQLQKDLKMTGWQGVALEGADRTIQFATAGIQLDLGGIVKGYALDRCAELLREHGIEHGLLHGGTSSVVAWGNDPDDQIWSVGIVDPLDHGGPLLETVSLNDEALSVSAVQGKSIHREGTEYGHVLDPATGQAMQDGLAGLAVGSSAARCDAWSTAVLVNPVDTCPSDLRSLSRFRNTGSEWLSNHAGPSS